MLSPEQIEVACILLVMALAFVTVFGLIWVCCWIFFKKGE